MPSQNAHFLDKLTIKALPNYWFLLENQEDGKKYIYNNESCEIASIPDQKHKNIEGIIAKILKSKTVVPQATSSPEKYLERKEYPRLMLFLTSSCNLNCIYCHCNSGTKQKNMGAINALKAIEKYLKYIAGITNSTNNPVEITFMGGGEPLLEIPTIKKIVRTIEEHKIDSKFVIVTNGTLGNDDDWSWIVNKKFRITISADGPPEIQNSQRRFPNKNLQSSFFIEKRLRYLSELDASVNIRSTVLNPERKNIYSICDYFTNFPCVNTHHLEPVSFAGRGKSNKDIKFYEKFYSQFFKSYSNFLYEKPTRFKSAWFKPFKRSHGFCGAVYFNSVLTHDGYISICSEVDSSMRSESYAKAYLVSHIQEDNPFLSLKAKEFSKKNSINKIPQCKKCIIRYKCGGGCYVKRDRDFDTNEDFFKAFCKNAIILNMSYLIGKLNDNG